jgi:hypothetical protein
VCLPASYTPFAADAVRRHSDQTAEAVGLAPERIPVGAGTVHPGMVEDGLNKVRDCGEDLGLKAMGWHLRFQGESRMDSPIMMRYIDLAVELGMVHLLHAHADCESEQPSRLMRIAKAFPQAMIAALVPFASVNQTEWAIETVQEIPDAAFELASEADQELILGENARRIFGVQS